MKILTDILFEKYVKYQPLTIEKHWNKLCLTDISNFGYHITSSAVYSSMIEGNSMDLDSYSKISSSGMDVKNKQFIEIEDLKKAYNYATKSKLNYDNLMNAHKIMSNHIIEDKNYSGKLRDKNVYIFSNGVKIYTGAVLEILKIEVDSFFEDILNLFREKLSIDKIFYYASLIHLIFVHIHPFADCNGRISRLLEKWFLAELLGKNAWYIQSEKYYQKNLKEYYRYLDIGKSYETLSLEKSLDFLLMLPKSLRIR